jgi:hemerythrin
MTVELAVFLGDWLRGHVIDSDVQMAKYVIGRQGH